jgi:hypothetical protein
LFIVFPISGGIMPTDDGRVYMKFGGKEFVRGLPSAAQQICGKHRQINLLGRTLIQGSAVLLSFKVDRLWKKRIKIWRAKVNSS